MTLIGHENELRPFAIFRQSQICIDKQYQIKNGKSQN